MVYPKARIAFSFRGKGKIVAFLLHEKSGSVLDVGARDRMLQTTLPAKRWSYFSADVEGSHDYIIDLEQRLNLCDHQFDCVVSLDVLEHVDNFHSAFGELARISSKWMVIALPNQCSYLHRLSILLRGKPSTDKYQLKKKHQRDRHRWFLSLADVDDALPQMAKEHGFSVVEVVYEAEGSRAARIIGWCLMQIAPILRRSLATRSIYLFERDRI